VGSVCAALRWSTRCVGADSINATNWTLKKPYLQKDIMHAMETARYKASRTKKKARGFQKFFLVF
jgi:hypothetical protein